MRLMTTLLVVASVACCGLAQAGSEAEARAVVALALQYVPSGNRRGRTCIVVRAMS